jgi:hypothetical protein
MRGIDAPPLYFAVYYLREMTANPGKASHGEIGGL